MLRDFELALYYAEMYSKIEMFRSSTPEASKNCGRGCVHIGIRASKLPVFNFRLEEANSL
jgi:hypothetical protein